MRVLFLFWFCVDEMKLDVMTLLWIIQYYNIVPFKFLHAAESITAPSQV